MKLPSRTMILANGAVALIVVGTLGFVAHSAIYGNDPEPCTVRYEKGTRLALERNGASLSTSDLQARLAGTDWGLDRARVVKLKSGTARHVLEFDLAARPGKTEESDEKTRDGVGFHWIPSQAPIGAAACLAYAVFLPENFEFGRGGRLPGLLGLPVAEGGEPDAVAFSTRYSWRERGAGDILPQLPGQPEARTIGNDRKGFVFPRGRWVQLEQEVVLNDTGRRNGIIRVWVDGDMRYQRTAVVFQEDKPARIAGVLSDVASSERELPKDSKVWVTPFELRWN